MIFQSIFLMTVIDILIVAATIASIVAILRYRNSLVDLKIFRPSLVILSGLFIFSALYAVDIAIMLVMPRLVSPGAAMAAMRELYFYWSGISALIGILLIVGGLLYLLTRLFPRIAANIATLQTEIAEREGVAAALRKNEELFRAILDHAPVFLALKDTEGRHLFVGPQCEQFYGVRREDAVGKLPHDLFDTDIADQFTAHDRAILETGQIVEQEDEIPLADGVHIIHSIKFPVPDGDGGVAGIGVISSDITERKRTEADLRRAHEELEARVEERTTELREANEALRRGEQKYRTLVETMREGIGIIDENGVVTYVNDRLCEMLGYGRDEMVGQTVVGLGLLDEANREIFARHMAAREEGGSDSYELTYVRKDGSKIPTITSPRPLHDATGKQNGSFAVMTDISDLKRAEAALRDSEASLVDAQRIAHLGSWNWNIETDELHWSDEIYRIFGLEPREFGATFVAFMNSVHPEDREIVQEAVDRSVREGAPYQCEHRVIRPDGSERVVFEQGEVTYDAGGAPIRMVGAVLDITARKRADEALRQSEKRLADAQRRASIGNLQWSIEHQRLEHWSDELLHIFGLSREQAPATYDDFDRLVHSEDRERLIELFDGLQTEPRAYEVEFRIVRSDGAVRYIREIGGVDDNGRQAATSISATLQDITERKHAEDALRESEAHLNAFFSNAPLGLAIYDTDLCYVRINQPLAIQSGLSIDEHIGQSLSEIKPEIAAKLESVYKRILETGEPVSGLEIEAELPSEPGEKRWWWGSAFATVRPDGTPFGIGVVAIDVTDRKRAEQELRESEARLNAFFDNAPIGLAMYDTDLRYTKINSHLAWKQGMPVGAHIGKTLHDIKPDVAGDLELIYRRVLETGEPNVNFEVAGELPSDPSTEHWWWGGAFPATWSDGKPSSLGVVAIDITERKRAEQALRESERRLKSITDNLPGGVYRRVRSPDGKISYPFVSEGFDRIFGIDPERMTANSGHIFDAIHPDDRDRARAAIEASAETLETYDQEYRLHGRSGGVTWCRSIATPRRLENGDIVWDGIAIDITDLKRAEQKLQESEARFRSLLDHAPMPILMKDLDRRFLVTNKTFTEWYGIDASKTPGKTSFDAHLDAAAREFDDIAREAIETGEAVEREIDAELLNGDKIIVAVKCFPVRDNDGQVIAVGAIDIDITERKRVEEELRAAGENLEAIIRAAPPAIIVLDLENRVLRWNRAAEAIFGWRAEEVIGNPHPIVPEEDQEDFRRNMARLAEGEDISKMELRRKRKNGGLVDVSLSTAPIHDSSGAVSAWVGIYEDITERKQAEAEIRELNEELEQRVEDRTTELAEANATLKSEIAERQYVEEKIRESEVRLRAIINATPNTIYLKDIQGRYVLINDRFADIVGFRTDEILGKTVEEFLPDGAEAVAAAVNEQDRAVLASAKVVEREIEIQGVEGPRILLIVKAPLLDAHGKVVGIVGVDTDITHLKNVEIALRESEAQFRIITDNIPALVAYLDSEHRYRFVNKTYCEWAQLPREKLEGRYMRDVLGPDAYRKLAPRIDAALSGQSVNFEEELVFPDDRRRNIEVSYVPEIVDDGDIKGIFVLVRDVTERKRTEEALKKARDELARKERLAVLGQLTATVSHELRNPLGTMRSSMFVLDKAIDQADERASRAAERVNRSIVRCDRIIDDLLDFTRAQVSNRQLIVVDEWLAELLDELPVPDGIELARDLGAAAVSVEIDPERLRRAVVNLYENARQAVSGAHPGTAPGPRIAVSSRLRGQSFEIAVSDTGPGIAPDNLGSIFEPLFSTKPFGTGLGLPTVKQIVEGHGGTVEVETEEGRGTTFRLLIPLHRVDEAAA